MVHPCSYPAFKLILLFSLSIKSICNSKKGKILHPLMYNYRNISFLGRLNNIIYNAYWTAVMFYGYWYLFPVFSLILRYLEQLFIYENTYIHYICLVMMQYYMFAYSHTKALMSWVFVDIFTDNTACNILHMVLIPFINQTKNSIS